jgi:gamma-glutamyltranspeptidase/glutathione hydrolase
LPVIVLALLLLLPAGADAASADRPGHAAIASAHELATQAGFEVLRAGGNAFDAAVAVAAALAVVEPQSSGIGGGGLFLLRRAADGKQVMVDARETAPAAVDARQYLDGNGKLDPDKAWNGALAAAIPGEPAALVWLARHYGRVALAVSLAPAIRIARDGFAPDARFLDELAARAEVIRRYPASAALLLDHGAVPKPGWTLRSPDLARTLQRIAAEGEDGFYRGELAETLVAGIRAAGGNWSLTDLANYRVKEREPLAFDYRGWRIVTASPPSSGGVLLAEMLNVLAGYDLARLDAVHRVHYIVEAMRLAYRDRAAYLGDPDFVAMPIARLTSPAYAARLRRFIRPERATPSASLPDYRATEPAQDRPHTTHFSIIDADGNLVSATQTVNLPFGNGMVVAGTGFLLNDEMDDFALQAGAPNAFGLLGNEANAAKPGHRPLSSMTPTLVIGRDRIGVIGTPGGSRIITMVLEAVLAFIDGASPRAIVDRPRYHHQYLPDVLSAEPGAFTAAQVKALEKMGYVIDPSTRRWGFMNVVSWDRKTGELQAASDPRGASGSGRVE